MNQLIYPTSNKDAPNEGTRHPAATNPDPSFRSIVGAFLGMAIVVMTVLFPTAMLAAAVTAAVVWGVGRMLNWRRPSSITLPVTGWEVHLSSHR